jgi:L-fuconolactonase
MVIDSHVHFFDADRIDGIVWPPVDSPIRAAGNATLARRLAVSRSLAGVIAVETSRRVVDDDWLLALADNEKQILGAVLNLQPDARGFKARFDLACEAQAFLGLRLRPINEYDLDSPAMLRNLRLLESYKKTIEFGAPDDHLKAAFAQLAAKLPGITLILDHAGHPNTDSHADDRWMASMRKIAACSNVAVKVTMISNPVAKWRLTLDALVELFGPKRLLYGSNWPAAEIAETADLEKYFGNDARAFFYDNARSAYGI